MKVALSVFGRFHAYDLAHQLWRLDALARLYTTYPKSEVIKYGIPRGVVSSWPALEVAFRAYMRLPFAAHGDNRMSLGFPALHDRLVARQLGEPIDVFHGWSQMSERSQHRARALGAVVTLERGSAHIRYQRDLLEEEYSLWGVRGDLPHRNVIEREEREYANADYVFVPSRFARETFLQRGFPEEKIILMPLGVSLQQFYPGPRGDDIFRVIYAGNMSLQKGVQYLLQAFAQLRLPHAELWLVGQMQPEMAQLFKQYEGTFTYLGKVPQSELQRLYTQCSVFALCSVQDGFGQVLTQAMACGLPVICSSNTGGPDVVTEGSEGYVVPIRDVEAIKNHLLFLYEHPESREEMGRRALLRAHSALSWDNYGDRMFATFQRLTGVRTDMLRGGIAE